METTQEVNFLKSKGFNIDACSNKYSDAVFETGDEFMIMTQGSVKAGKNLKFAIAYCINDIQEPITKKMLRHIKKELGAPYTLYTNAGVELHSREIINNKFEGIEIIKTKFNQ